MSDKARTNDNSSNPLNVEGALVVETPGLLTRVKNKLAEHKFLTGFGVGVLTTGAAIAAVRMQDEDSEDTPEDPTPSV